MIIGPFWCEQKNSWLRFVGEAGQFHAEMAIRDTTNPSLTTNWQDPPEDAAQVEHQDQSSNSHGFWVVNYEMDSPQPIKEAFRLQNGALYQTNFVDTRLRGVIVNVFKEEGKFIYDINRNANPFANFKLPEVRETTYDDLPVTPETQQAQALQREQEKQLAQQRVEEQWRVWQAKNVRENLDCTTFSSFDEQVNASLLAYLVTEFTGLNPTLHNTFESYLEALNNVLSNPNDKFNELIFSFAAKTDIDQECGLNPDNDSQTRADLYERKQAFIFGVFQAERQNLLDYYSMTGATIVPVPLKKIEVRAREEVIQPPPANYHVQNGDLLPHQAVDYQAILANLLNPEPAPVIEDNDEELQRALQLSLLEQQGRVIEAPPPPVPDDELVDDEEMQQAIAQSLQTQFMPVHDQIKHAVYVAVQRYKLWYDGENQTCAPRFFSLRHGKEGQERAKNHNELVASSIDAEDAIGLINQLLIKPSTRYRPHSFATFLLNELVLIPNGPWAGLACNHTSRCYNQQEVVARCSQNNSQQMGRY